MASPLQSSAPYFVDMSGDNHLNLLPPLIESGHLDEFVQSGQTLAASLSPLDNSVAVLITTVCGLPMKIFLSTWV